MKVKKIKVPFAINESHNFFNAKAKNHMIKPLSLLETNAICFDCNVAVDQGDYSKAMVESMSLVKLCAVVNLGISRALATSTLPTCWSYKVERVASEVSMDELIKFINGLTGADLVQVIFRRDAYDNSYVIYRLPII